MFSILRNSIHAKEKTMKPYHVVDLNHPNKVLEVDPLARSIRNPGSSLFFRSQIGPPKK